ncbi:MAG: hypothetical protein ABIS35_15235 [Terracoccus sp.]
MPTIRDLTLAVSGSSWMEAAVTVGYRLELSPSETDEDGAPPCFEEWIEILADEPGGDRPTLIHALRPTRLPAVASPVLDRTRQVLLPGEPGWRPYAPRPVDSPTVRKGDRLLLVIELRRVDRGGATTRAVGQTGPVPGWT